MWDSRSSLSDMVFSLHFHSTLRTFSLTTFSTSVLICLMPLSTPWIIAPKRMSLFLSIIFGITSDNALLVVCTLVCIWQVAGSVIGLSPSLNCFLSGVIGVFEPSSVRLSETSSISIDDSCSSAAWNLGFFLKREKTRF